jgi:ribosomal protein S18 acetylase RimI-like enzyme
VRTAQVGLGRTQDGTVTEDAAQHHDRFASAVARSAALVEALPDDTFAQVCGRGELVLELRTTPGAALWRGSPWGSGWVGGGDAAALGDLIAEVRPDELTVPASLGVPVGYARGWGWGWHAITTAPQQQPGEHLTQWLPDGDRELADLVERAFPDAETPPNDPRVAGWFGARVDGRLVAAAASLTLGLAPSQQRGPVAGNPAGTVGPAGGAALLSSLTVDPAARRSGWARAVTAWFVRERFARGAAVVGLGTYLSNEPARALYDRLGFVEVPYIGGTAA